ncbi:hypothetical protein BaRGS_00039627 [Batillaria attramentaria]|uniref:BZIP domain-containing protein n=1 Tax=Batillaria attramentaria TaxID=370345 RepID=A0ABD0J390_9CAEN
MPRPKKKSDRVKALRKKRERRASQTEHVDEGSTAEKPADHGQEQTVQQKGGAAANPLSTVSPGGDVVGDAKVMIQGAEAANVSAPWSVCWQASDQPVVSTDAAISLADSPSADRAPIDKAFSFKQKRADAVRRDRLRKKYARQDADFRSRERCANRKPMREQKVLVQRSEREKQVHRKRMAHVRQSSEYCQQERE